MLIARFARSAVLSLLAAAPAAKAADCPVTTLVAPFPAGSTTDTIARALAKDMGTQLTTAVVVENKPGAEGQIAALDVLKAKPDGCRLLFATSGNLSIAPHIRRQPPYEARRDFTAIADIGRYTYLLYTSASFPARNYAEFVAQVKRKPGQYNYGTGSNTNLMAFAHLSQKSGLEMTRIPFKGEPPAIQEIIAGRVQAIVATTMGVPHVENGRLRALAVMGSRRTELLPDTPTLAELGVPALDIVPWAGLFGPAGVPSATAERLHAIVNKALASKEVSQAARAAGFELNASGRPEFERLIAEQDAVYRQKIQELGLLED
ncbi:MAG: tripartite tricarboxylate transporter substrate binding protein [Pigmentiphaga sp.]|uniref:Bug family tripartite tricarboxylate transporter substrate binding protein n=1 Tax=Pigmentiphaga sp. TaxID=1977564 RepID=UPI0029B9BC6F|nr:tripartite tricarboxylate transporter substrate binding protein [Pigmentiphaga sp.]MDX3904296.1 tripartite tricarboxylate transporter substrate binding protein [Pigmentiphaga sp.]